MGRKQGKIIEQEINGKSVELKALQDFIEKKNGCSCSNVQVMHVVTSRIVTLEKEIHKLKGKYERERAGLATCSFFV